MHVRGLQALDVPTETYGSLLVPVLMTKIPEDIRLLVGREIKDGEWNISEILKLLRNKWSMFCKQQHPTASCHVVTNKMARKECLKKQGRCFICFRKSHLARDCRSKISCFKCSGRHHVSLCEIEPQTTERPETMANRQTNVNVTAEMPQIASIPMRKQALLTWGRKIQF